jgi:hypothetical protein
MSRFSPTYFKFQSAMTFSILPITAAYPSVPFLFVYRDPVQVMVSHFKGSANALARSSTGGGGTPNCARRKNPYPGVEGEIVGLGGGGGGRR